MGKKNLRRIEYLLEWECLSSLIKITPLAFDKILYLERFCAKIDMHAGSEGERMKPAKKRKRGGERKEE